MAVRPGFVIPNADTYAPDYQTAQPDAGDFLIVGNTNTGVVLGCEVAFAGLTASLGSGPHIVVIDGEVFLVPGNQQVSIQGKGSLPRWDLIVFDTSAGGYRILAGVPQANPVYADITDTMVVLAAIFVPTTGGGDPHCVDKRNFLGQAVVAPSTSGSLMRSYDGISVQFNIDGSGKITWGTGTVLEQTSDGVLRVTNELDAGILRADTEATVDGYDVVTRDFITWGHGTKPVVGIDIGDIWVDDTTGDISVWRNGGWASGLTEIPTGTIIMSLESPANMGGWLPLWGGSYHQADVGNLWARHPEWISGGLMTLPDMRDRFPLGAGTGASAAGTTHGTLLDHTGAIVSHITVNQLPSHSHQTDATTGSGGSHSHLGSAQSGGAISSLTTNDGGFHGHFTYDPGHTHAWAVGWPMVATEYGDSSIDNLFPDDEHHGVMQAAQFSLPAQTGTVILQDGLHSHTTPPISGHSHTISTDTAAAHTHPAPAHSAVGSGDPVTFTPPSMSINFYIKI